MNELDLKYCELKYDGIFYTESRAELGAIEVSSNTAWRKLDNDRTKLALGLHRMLQLIHEDVRTYNGDASKLETIGLLHGGKWLLGFRFLVHQLIFKYRAFYAGYPHDSVISASLAS